MKTKITNLIIKLIAKHKYNLAIKLIKIFKPFKLTLTHEEYENVVKELQAIKGAL